MDVAKYFDLIENSTYIENLNRGVVIDEDKKQGGMAFNTGQLYNKEVSPQTAWADGTHDQSHYANQKNIK
jgi:hypothetical protein